MISSLMFIWLRSTLPQFASYLSSFQTDPSIIIKIKNNYADLWVLLHYLNNNRRSSFEKYQFASQAKMPS